MRRATLAVFALAACGSQAPENETSAATTNVVASAPAPATVPTTRANTNLRAAVSPLSGSTSGLNVRVTDLATIVALPTDALFAFDSAELGPDSVAGLRSTAELIRAGGPGTIEIVGHTDAKGTDDYNVRLSQARAQAVADWMSEQVGVRLRAFEVAGRGETSPVAPNTGTDGGDDPAGRARNRRVEVVIPKG